MKECGRRGGKGEKDGQGKERRKETIGGRDDVEGGSERKEETMQDKKGRGGRGGDGGEGNGGVATGGGEDAREAARGKRRWKKGSGLGGDNRGERGRNGRGRGLEEGKGENGEGRKKKENEDEGKEEKEVEKGDGEEGGRR